METTTQTATARKPIRKSVRYDILKRDNFTCQYCGRSAPEVVLEIDHRNPVSNGGTNDRENLVVSCYDCNRGKGAKVDATNTNAVITTTCTESIGAIGPVDIICKEITSRLSVILSCDIVAAISDAVDSVGYVVASDLCYRVIEHRDSISAPTQTAIGDICKAASDRTWREPLDEASMYPPLQLLANVDGVLVEFYYEFGTKAHDSDLGPIDKVDVLMWIASPWYTMAIDEEFPNEA